jgi:hypothetical protein
VQEFHLVDLVDEKTWPTDVVAMLRSPDFDGSFERKIRGMLMDRPIAMYHATRLLPEEVDDIAQGLQLQTREVRARKLGRFVARGLISPAQAHQAVAEGHAG